MLIMKYDSESKDKKYSFYFNGKLEGYIFCPDIPHIPGTKPKSDELYKLMNLVNNGTKTEKLFSYLRLCSFVKLNYIEVWVSERKNTDGYTEVSLSPMEFFLKRFYPTFESLLRCSGDI